jgi:hypothetical protein
MIYPALCEESLEETHYHALANQQERADLKLIKIAVGRP